MSDISQLDAPQTEQIKTTWYKGPWGIAALLTIALAISACGGGETSTEIPQATTPDATSVSDEQGLLDHLQDWTTTEPRLSRVTLVDTSADADIIEMGYLACDALAAGNTGADLVQVVMESVAYEYQEDAAYMMGASIESLCPEYGYLLDQ